MLKVFSFFQALLVIKQEEKEKEYDDNPEKVTIVLETAHLCSPLIRC